MSVAKQFVLPSISDFKKTGLFGTAVSTAPAGWHADVVPNFGDWQPGDIVLVSARGIAGILISGGQYIVSEATLAACKWSHCGIYVGGHYLIDALPNPHGVHVRSIRQYCETRMVTVRRASVGYGRLLPIQDGQDIADFAKRQIGAPYAMAHLVKLALSWMGGQGSTFRHDPRARAFYCSSFVVQCYAAAASMRLDGPGCCPCLPATLDQHPDLVPVPVAWRRVIP